MDNLQSIVAGLAVGFAFGSIPFGYLLVRWVSGADVRDSGSGNIGATNVGRALGRGGGLATLVLDAAKGGAAVLAAGYLGFGAAEAAFGAVLGHCYTPWLSFRGGKGVATLLGGFGVVAAVPTVIAAGLIGLVVAGARRMSLASLCGAAILPVAAWWMGVPPATTVSAAAAAVLIIWRHKANIGRLIDGREPRIGRVEP